MISTVVTRKAVNLDTVNSFNQSQTVAHYTIMTLKWTGNGQSSQQSKNLSKVSFFNSIFLFIKFITSFLFCSFPTQSISPIPFE